MRSIVLTRIWFSSLNPQVKYHTICVFIWYHIRSKLFWCYPYMERVFFLWLLLTVLGANDGTNDVFLPCFLPLLYLLPPFLFKVTDFYSILETIWTHQVREHCTFTLSPELRKHCAERELKHSSPPRMRMSATEGGTKIAAGINFSCNLIQNSPGDWILVSKP